MKYLKFTFVLKFRKMAGTCELELEPFTVRVTVSCLSICVMYFPHCLSLWCIPYTLAHTHTHLHHSTRSWQAPTTPFLTSMPRRLSRSIMSASSIGLSLVHSLRCVFACVCFPCFEVCFVCSVSQWLCSFLYGGKPQLILRGGYTTCCKYAFNDMRFAGTFFFLCVICVYLYYSRV
jgi:hypothetical protein